MEFENVLKLIQYVSQSNLNSFCLKDGTTKITMEKGSPVKTEVSAVSSDAALPEAKIKAEGEDKIIKSPLVGTFYSSASPDQKDFIQVGDTVSVGQTLGIVEAMKLMNEIESEFDGIVKEILVQNEQVVEYGQPLFIIQ